MVGRKDEGEVAKDKKKKKKKRNDIKGKTNDKRMPEEVQKDIENQGKEVKDRRSSERCSSSSSRRDEIKEKKRERR